MTTNITVPQTPVIPVVGPRTQIDPNPRDRGSVYTPLWVAWIAAFAVIEAKALWDEKRAAPGNRVKRTLSSHLRYWAATDSVTGIPLNVPHGKLRPMLFASARNWFNLHIDREGLM